MDESETGFLYVPETNAVRVFYPGGSYLDVLVTGAKVVLIDRPASTDGVTRYFMTRDMALAEAFNHNPIEYGPGPPFAESPARHLGGLVYGRTDGRLQLDPHWYYGFGRQRPQRVLLRNEGADNWGYPSPDQTTDHVIEMQIEGWSGVPLTLRLLDPPDLATYGLADLDDATAYTEFPYHADDNLGETGTSWPDCASVCSCVRLRALDRRLLHLVRAGRGGPSLHNQPRAGSRFLC